MPRIVLLGPPGSGKGTHAELIEKEYHIPTISTGNALREELTAGSNIGLKAKYYMDAGRLVPDEIILDMIEGFLEKHDVTNGFIFDGFPRTVHQAETLDLMLAKKDKQIEIVVLMSAPPEILVERIINRRVCPNCGAGYNLSWKNPITEGHCDVCGTALIQREDDKEETIINRINVYNEQTIPLVDYYEKQGILIEVDVTKDVDTRQEQIDVAIRKRHDKNQIG